MYEAEYMKALAEPLDYEAEYPVAEHIYGIHLAVKPLFEYLGAEDMQQYGIEDDLSLAGGIAKIRPGNDKSLTAAVDKAVEARTEQREYEREAHYVKHHPHIAAEYLRPQKIEQWHQQYAAVEAQVTGLAGPDQSLEPRKELNAYNADQRMQYGDNKRRVPFDAQLLFEKGQPEEGYSS